MIPNLEMGEGGSENTKWGFTVENIFRPHFDWESCEQTNTLNPINHPRRPQLCVTLPFAQRIKNKNPVELNTIMEEF